MDNKLTKTFHLILQVITMALSSFISGHVYLLSAPYRLQTATMHYAELSFHLPYATHKGVYVIVINTFLKEIKFSFIVFIIALLCSASSFPVHEINIVMLLYYSTITGIPKLWIANGSWSSLRPLLNKSNSAYTQPNIHMWDGERFETSIILFITSPAISPVNQPAVISSDISFHVLKSRYIYLRREHSNLMTIFRAQNGGNAGCCKIYS